MSSLWKHHESCWDPDQRNTPKLSEVATHSLGGGKETKCICQNKGLKQTTQAAGLRKQINSKKSKDSISDSRVREAGGRRGGRVRGERGGRKPREENNKPSNKQPKKHKEDSISDSGWAGKGEGGDWGARLSICSESEMLFLVWVRFFEPSRVPESEFAC